MSLTNVLDAEIIYPTSNSKWVNLTNVVPKKSKINVVKNEKDEQIPTWILSS